MILSTWIIWGATSLVFNCANAINRRALQSQSRFWNGWSSFIVGVLFASSVVGIGTEILRAGSRREVAFAVVLYGAMCVVGSVLGQEIVLRAPYFKRIEGRDDN